MMPRLGLTAYNPEFEPSVAAPDLREAMASMNSGGDTSASGGELLGCPSLCDWTPGASYAALAADEIRVWRVELDAGLETEAQIDGALPGPELPLLSADEQERAARFVRARDRRRFVRCRAALREILGGLLAQAPGSIRFRARGNGKPELDAGLWRDGPPNLRFNLSHSADLALIAVCRGRELGVDLEQVRPIGEAQRIVASYFSPSEQAAFAALADDAKPLAFVRGWTRKEAILKGLGSGLAGLSARYETGFATIELTGRFTPAVPSPRVAQWQLWEAAPRPGFVATVAGGVAGEADPGQG
jgi:4'-phosphopantetheinyl transferase